ncbi:MAG: hypothetical protein H6622_15595 [Halobacteriovoraceae bacterium]|nr:hypothetical protein [Halobacteriovoraceae bacterium]
MRKFENKRFPKSNWNGEFTPPQGLPIVIEIGCGVGLHPIRFSKENPDKFLVAIEHTQTKFEKFYRRYKNNRMPSNLLPVHANALSWINEFVPENYVDQYIFLFPNPYPKKSQENKRFYAMPFFGHLIDTLKNKGKILMATNEEFYYSGHRKYLSDVWGLKIVSDKQNKIGENIPRTHFEKKYLERGDTIYELEFVKD